MRFSEKSEKSTTHDLAQTVGTNHNISDCPKVVSSKLEVSGISDEEPILRGSIQIAIESVHQ